MDFLSLNSQNHKQSPPCLSVRLIADLRALADTKTSENNRADYELLFPPKVIENLIFNTNALSLLRCSCVFCMVDSGSDDPPQIPNLMERLKKDEEQENRRLFCVLVFMGAGCLARQLCSVHNRGDGISPQDITLDGILKQILLIKGRNLASRFKLVFNEVRTIFGAPNIEIGYDIDFTDTHLPFLNERPLRLKSNREGTSSKLIGFEIHTGYRGQYVLVCMPF